MIVLFLFLRLKLCSANNDAISSGDNIIFTTNYCKQKNAVLPGELIKKFMLMKIKNFNKAN